MEAESFGLDLELCRFSEVRLSKWLHFFHYKMEMLRGGGVGRPNEVMHRKHWALRKLWNEYGVGNHGGCRVSALAFSLSVYLRMEVLTPQSV